MFAFMGSFYFAVVADEGDQRKTHASLGVFLIVRKHVGSDNYVQKSAIDRALSVFAE